MAPYGYDERDSPMFDLIGDIHGHGERLVALLVKLGYRERNGVYAHPGRQMIFLGDLVDRGPTQLETLRIVRSMVDAGNALIVMGNHEFNAIGLATEDPSNPGQYLRPRSAKNLHQQEAFMHEVPLDSALHGEIIDWFKTIPLFLETPQLRAIHACWHPESLATLAPYVQSDNTLKPSAWTEVFRKGLAPFDAVEVLLKGPEMELPNGIGYHDKDGVARTTSRIRWWDQTALTYRDAGLVPPALREQLPLDLLPESELIRYDNSRPLFFGHYWMRGTPALLGQRIACLDYSIGHGRPSGKLCAYRWDGEVDLMPSHFVWVDGVAQG